MPTPPEIGTWRAINAADSELRHISRERTTSVDSAHIDKTTRAKMSSPAAANYPNGAASGQ